MPHTLMRTMAALDLVFVSLSTWSDEVAPRNPTPCANIDWSTVEQIPTTSHGHQTDQTTLDRAVAAGCWNTG